MSEKRIQSGDTVNVYFEHVEVIIGAEVLCCPCETNNGSWILRDTEGRVINVQSYCKIVRIKDQFRSASEAKQ